MRIMRFTELEVNVICREHNIYIFCDDGVDSGIAESRESPSAIINHEITAKHDDLRSLLHVK